MSCRNGLNVVAEPRWAAVRRHRDQQPANGTPCLAWNSQRRQRREFAIHTRCSAMGFRRRQHGNAPITASRNHPANAATSSSVTAAQSTPRTSPSNHARKPSSCSGTARSNPDRPGTAPPAPPADPRPPATSTTRHPNPASPTAARGRADPAGSSGVGSDGREDVAGQWVQSSGEDEESGG
jgi:hypothetical protein